MATHLFELSGRTSDIDELEPFAPAYGCAVRRHDGGVYLGSSDFDASISHTEARTLAAERVRVLNALARLRNHLFKPLALGSGLTVDGEGGRSITIHPAPAVGVAMVSLDAIVVGGANPPPSVHSRS